MLDLDNRLTDFLSGKNGEVICIAGKWGTGKTYAWRRVLKQAAQSGHIGHKKYSYISLFGAGSLAELRTATFENAINVSDIGDPHKVNDLGELLDRIVGSTRRNTTLITKLIPFLGLKGDFSILASLFMNVRDYVICVDDLERRPASLPLADVLGLVSFLAQERNCKVAVLLNDGELSDSDSLTLTKFSEKVFDSVIRFSPDPSYALEASALQPESILLLQCERLGIVNIRVLNKILKSFSQLSPIISDHSDELKKQAAQSIALLGWSVHEPELAPKLSYILNDRVSFMFGVRDEDKEVPPEIASWNALLDKAEFSNADDFDRALAEGIQNGFFDTDKVKKYALINDRNFSKAKSQSAIQAAWNKYHSSFKNNQDEIIEILFTAYIENISQVGVMDLQSVVALFRDFGESDKATSVIKAYVEKSSLNPENFDISSYPWIEEIKDTEIKDALSAALESLQTPADVKVSMLSMFSKGGGIGGKQMEVLSAAPVEDYVRVFKESEGQDLKAAVASCLEFDRISNASPEMRTITAKAKEALKIIGSENAFNARKVKGYGVDVAKTYYSAPTPTPSATESS
jgi:hypothetical protein